MRSLKVAVSSEFFRLNTHRRVAPILLSSRTATSAVRGNDIPVGYDGCSELSMPPRSQSCCLSSWGSTN